MPRMSRRGFGNAYHREQRQGARMEAKHARLKAPEGKPHHHNFRPEAPSHCDYCGRAFGTGHYRYDRRFPILIERTAVDGSTYLMEKVGAFCADRPCMMNHRMRYQQVRPPKTFP